MGQDCTACSGGNVSGNSTYHIPVKVGEPLSTACERAKTIGSIPSVIRTPWYTLVDGAVVTGDVSNAGICNTASFFKSRSGCYDSKDAQTSGSTCA